jgi:hypothetical protein
MHYHGMMHLVLFISLTLQDYGSVGWLWEQIPLFSHWTQWWFFSHRIYWLWQSAKRLID